MRKNTLTFKSSFCKTFYFTFYKAFFQNGGDAKKIKLVFVIFVLFIFLKYVLSRPRNLKTVDLLSKSCQIEQSHILMTNMVK